MPSADESLGFSSAGATRRAASMTTVSAGGDSAGSAAVASAPLTGGSATPGPAESGRGRRGSKIFSLPGRRPQAPQGDTTSADEAGLPGAAAVSGVQTAGAVQAAGVPGATATQAGRGGRPLLVAAAVAGAVLATVPFVHGRGGTTNYEGLGQAAPIASMSPDTDGDSMPRPDGHASSMPLQDPVGGVRGPMVPQPQISPTFRSGSADDDAAGPAADVLDWQDDAVRPPGKHVPLVGPVIPTDRRGLGPAVGPPVRPRVGPVAILPDGEEESSLSRAGVGTAEDRTDSKGSAPAGTDSPSHPEAKQKPLQADEPATSTKASLLSATSSGATGAKAADKPAMKAAVKADKAEDTSVATAKEDTAARKAGPAKEATPAEAAVKSPAVKATAAKEAKPAETAVKSATVKATAAKEAKPAEAATPVKAATPEWGTRVVRATTVIGPGQSVASNRMRVTMGTNGSLVISDENGVVRWSSHTEGRGYKAVFQDDGHFVVYTRDDRTAWSSGTAGNPGAQLVIQGDGNVTIQSAGGASLWSAGTQH